MHMDCVLLALALALAHPVQKPVMTMALSLLPSSQGFAELEYGILRWMGAIDDSTLVVTTVHDLQLVDDISEDMMLEHDVPVDIIVTPTQVCRTCRMLCAEPCGCVQRQRLRSSSRCCRSSAREQRGQSHLAFYGTSSVPRNWAKSGC